jgi:hypothetical protein
MLHWPNPFCDRTEAPSPCAARLIDPVCQALFFIFLAKMHNPNEEFLSPICMAIAALIA